MSPEESEALTRIELLSEKVGALEEADNDADRLKWKIVLSAIGGVTTVFILVIQLMWPAVNLGERLIADQEERTVILRQIGIDTKNNADNNAAFFKYVMDRDSEASND